MPVVTVGSTSPAKKRGPGRKTLAKTLAAATRPATTEPAAPTPTDSLTTFGAAPTVTVLKTRTALEYWEVHVPFKTYALGQPAPHEADAQEAVEFELAALRRAWIAKHAARHHEVNDERPMQVVCDLLCRRSLVQEVARAPARAIDKRSFCGRSFITCAPHSTAVE